MTKREGLIEGFKLVCVVVFFVWILILVTGCAVVSAPSDCEPLYSGDSAAIDSCIERVIRREDRRAAQELYLLETQHCIVIDRRNNRCAISTRRR